MDNVSETVVKVEILEWRKYQYRQDLKSMPWFKVQTSMAKHQKLYKLSPEVKWSFLCLLSYCAEKVSGDVEFLGSYFMDTFDLPNLYNSLELLSKRKLIKCRVYERESIEDIDAKVCLRIEKTREDENILASPRAYKRETRAQARSDFDFKKLYAPYPKKDGKKAGMLKLKSIVTNQQKFDDVEKAIKNYVDHIAREKLELKFVKKFSTFVNNYEDWLEVDEKVVRKRTAPKVWRQNPLDA